MSTTNAGLAKKLGYKNIRVYLEGEPAWSEAGYPTYTSKGFIDTGNIVLIDLRASHKAVEGRIKRAISVPYDDLEDKINDIPRNAPVILYSDDKEEATDAVDDLRSDGFKHVALVPGNYAGWVSAGWYATKLLPAPIRPKNRCKCHETRSFFWMIRHVFSSIKIVLPVCFVFVQKYR